MKLSKLILVRCQPGAHCGKNFGIINAKKFEVSELKYARLLPMLRFTVHNIVLRFCAEKVNNCS